MKITKLRISHKNADRLQSGVLLLPVVKKEKITVQLLHPLAVLSVVRDTLIIKERLWPRLLYHQHWQLLWRRFHL